MSQEGHRQRLSTADKLRIVPAAAEPGLEVSEIAAARVSKPSVRDREVAGSNPVAPTIL
jgi:hypothetical protein